MVFYKGRLHIPNDDALKLLVTSTEYDSKIAGHFGQDKTEELITRNFHWLNLHEYVRQYVSTCDICQRNKSPRHKKYGFLDPLELPTRVWGSISMDFVTDLPLVQGFTQIWVIVDRFSKMVHLIPLPTKVTAEELAQVFTREIWRLHGLPDSILLDRYSKFISRFWKSLLEQLEIKRKLSTAFHPQTDGQTERVNQVIEAYLQIFSNYKRTN